MANKFNIFKMIPVLFYLINSLLDFIYFNRTYFISYVSCKNSYVKVC
jgi:hypothetical protein